MVESVDDEKVYEQFMLSRGLFDCSFVLVYVVFLRVYFCLVKKKYVSRLSFILIVFSIIIFYCATRPWNVLASFWVFFLSIKMQSLSLSIHLVARPDSRLCICNEVVSNICFFFQIANRLDRVVADLGRKPLKVLVQVNTSGEECGYSNCPF